MPTEIQAPPEVPSSQPGAFSRAKIECSLFKNASAATTGSSKEQSAQQKLVYLMGGVSARKGRLITRIPRIIDKKKKRGLTGGSAEWWERSPASEAAA
jgi:predicted Ser/Thr protein kinase